MEAPPETLYRQNRLRPRPVPEPAIRRMLDRWEAPDLAEAHQVEWNVTPGWYSAAPVTDDNG
jgi:tRNA uridine 5-carbamoylmethylation protein Kti12